MSWKSVEFLNTKSQYLVDTNASQNRIKTEQHVLSLSSRKSKYRIVNVLDDCFLLLSGIVSQTKKASTKYLAGLRLQRKWMYLLKEKSVPCNPESRSICR
mmetsp:Transcript_1184/g.1403  ORF Transcript_1184/g.1403 Transcript_1184/m.1403 type:complete len:100 (-) Transcript_1184:117-416(-)